MDKLEEIFRLRKEFMNELAKNVPGHSNDFPLDVSKKQSQIALKDVTLRGVEEMFEALQHLKNSKTHRQTDIPHFDHEEFLEEFVDAFNFFFSTLVMIGVTPDELFDAYKKKHQIIIDRINQGY